MTTGTPALDPDTLREPEAHPVYRELARLVDEVIAPRAVEADRTEVRGLAPVVGAAHFARYVR